MDRIPHSQLRVRCPTLYRVVAASEIGEGNVPMTSKIRGECDNPLKGTTPSTVLGMTFRYSAGQSGT